jgi:hypothetical protein
MFCFVSKSPTLCSILRDTWRYYKVGFSKYSVSYEFTNK